MTDNNRIVIPRCYPRTELFTVLGFKVFLGCYKDICRGIELQILGCPLLNKVVRHYKHTLIAKTKALTLLCCGYHCKGLACSNDVGKQGITAVHNPRNRIRLMLTELDFGVHSVILDMASVVLTWANTVELLIVELTQTFSTLGIFPNPLLKSSLDLLLLALRDSGFLLIKNSFLVAVLIHNIVVNADVFKVKSFLDNLVSVDAFCSVNTIRLDVTSVLGLICQHPLRSMRNEFDLYKPSDIIGIAKQFVNKVVNILGRNPNRTELYTDFRSGQILRLHLFKSFHIDVIVGRKLLCRPSCKRKLLSHVARKVFVCHQIFAMTEHITMLGVEIDNALQVGIQFFLGLSRQFTHKLHINHSTLTERYRQGFTCRVNPFDYLLRLYRALGKHICFGFQFLVIIKDFKRAKKKISVIVRENQGIATAIDKSVFVGKGVILFVKSVLKRLDFTIGSIIKLRVDKLSDSISNSNHSLNTVLSRHRSFHGCHNGIFSVIHLSVNERVGKILNGWICG